MITYEFYSKKYECNIRFKYGAAKILVGFELMEEKELTVDELVKLLEGSLYQNIFLATAKKHGLNVVEILEDISFDAFWKICFRPGSSKPKSEAGYNKLDDKNKSAAIRYWPVLLSIKAKDGTAIPYTNTYLNSKPWIK